MKRTQVSKSTRATGRVAEYVARSLAPKRTGALVLGLVGELGAGKTLFVQHIARTLGVRARMPSPTFLIVRQYPLPRRSIFKTLYHLDVYRIKTKQELDSIQFFRILKDSRSMVLIEWADRIQRYLPKGTRIIRLAHGKRSNERIITLPMKSH